MNRVLVTGGSGGVGRLIVSKLLEKLSLSSVSSLSSDSSLSSGSSLSSDSSSLSPFVLRVSSRNPDTKLSLPSSVEVVKADLGNPSCYPSLFQDVTKVFMYIQGTHANLDALLESAKSHGVKHIVFLSSSSVSLPSNFVGQMHKRVEDSIIKKKFTFTFLRASVFNTNCISFWAEEIKRDGRVSIPYPDSFSSCISNEDISEIATIALTTNLLDNQSPILTGPHSLSQRKQIEILDKVRREKYGKGVEIKEITPEEWKAKLSLYTPQSVADSILELWKATERIEQEISEEVVKFTGKCTSFEEWVRVHSTELFLN